MQLGFQRRHLSITGFPTIDLPPLTIIVGINGSGKTHLLQAIQNGSVYNSVAPTQPQHGGALSPNSGPIRLLSNSALNNAAQPGATPGMSVGPVAETTYNTQPHMPMPPPAQPGGGFENARRTLLSSFLAPLEAGLGQDLSAIVEETEDPWRLGIDELVRRSGGKAKTGDLTTIFEQAAHALANPQPGFSSDRPFPEHYVHQLQPAALAADKLGVSILNVTLEQIGQFQPWGTDQFHFDLATLFGRYRDRYLRNRLQRLTDEEQGTTKALSQEAFFKAFGRPPWTSLNETFAAFRLPYEVTAPEQNDYSPVSFSLRKVGSGEQVHTSNLSSGERVLLQFAISSYQHDDGMTNINRPKLLLLDELDAPLHPEMVHRWLRAISEALVAGQGIHCILTTHSPTTVALAPEDALYEMRDGQSGLTKVSKQDALNKLTFGVPTLSIDYSGRRQVFTESDTDAAIYERVYSLIKARIECARELNFLSTGMRNKDGGEINSGCTVVTNIVHSLNEAGNQSVYGIVDWDGSATSTDRVRVIAEGSHDGIENLLLDPLLICLLLFKERKAPEGLTDIERLAGADTLAAADLQRMVDAIQNKVVTTGSGLLASVTYLDGATANVLQDYLIMDDHMLEDRLRAAFPLLRKWSNRGALVMAVVDEVLTEHRGFCPAPLKVMFEGVANA